MLPRLLGEFSMTTSDRSGPQVVTGGAGAIGSVLVRELVARGHEVRVIDNLSSGRREHLAGLLDDSKASLHVLDLREPEAIRPVFEGTEGVWHLAANPDIRLGTEDPRLDFDHGTLATFNVLQAARRAKVRRFYFSSSSVVYGLPTVFPTPEEYGPLLPQSLYGGSKLASEAQISAFATSFGFRAFLFRFANIIGPTMTHGVIYDFFEKLARTPAQLDVLGDGRQAKSYLTDEECVEGMLFAAEHADESVNVFNLGTTDQVSVRTIAERVVQAAGGQAKIVFTGGERGWTGDIPQQLLSIAKLERLGWTPRLTSAEAVNRTIDALAARRHRAAG
jgi:UDP-glucose 4-epimerase